MSCYNYHRGGNKNDVNGPKKTDSRQYLSELREMPTQKAHRKVVGLQNPGGNK